MDETDDSRTALAAEIEQLRKRYLEHLRVELDEMARSAALISGLEADRQALVDIRHRLHQLAGSAGTFGVAAIGERARVLEETASNWLDAPLDGLDEASLSAFIAGVKELAAT